MKRLIGMVMVVAAGYALCAGTVQVTDYSWLQLPVEDALPFVGSEVTPSPIHTVDTAGYSRSRTIEYFRWGERSWSPAYGLTSSDRSYWGGRWGWYGGDKDWWAGIVFSEPRNVSRVRVQVDAAPEHTQIRRFRIDGTTNGTDYEEIGLYDFGGFVDVSHGATGEFVDVAVTNDVYHAIRVRMNGHQGYMPTENPGYDAGTYHPGSDPYFPSYADYWSNTDYGAPGFSLIEPFGDGLVDEELANLANRDVFNTEAWCTLEHPNGNGTDDVSIHDGNLLKAGSYVGHRGYVAWDGETQYLQIDLKATQAVWRTVLVFRGADGSERATDVSFEHSNDGVNFTPLSGRSAPILRGESAVEYIFPAVEARYWRITGAAGYGGYQVFNLTQWMLYKTSNHPPVVKGKDASWVFTYPIVPLSWQEVDDGSFDPDGDDLIYSVVPNTFKQSDIDSHVPVTFTVSDGVYAVSTNLLVTVTTDLQLEGVALVQDYSWLQLPTEEITPFVGSEVTAEPINTAGYTRAGAIDCFRWGAPAWNPSTGLTSAGGKDYWAGYLFAEARNVSRVTVQVGVATGHAKVRRFRIEGSEDGESFSEIGLYDFGAMVDISGNVFEPVSVDVTPGDYRVLRVRYNGSQGVESDDPNYDPDYTGNHDYGGPGLALFEPFGDGLVDEELVNLANRDVFYTDIVCTLELPGTANVNSGCILPDGSPQRHRIYVPWDESRYLQIDLGAAQPVWRTALKFRGSNTAVSDVTFAASVDGVNFTPVEGRSAPVLHTNDDYGRYTAVEYTFPPVEARYWRITGVTYVTDEFQLDQWMLYKTSNRAPVVMARDITWTLTLPVVSLPWTALDMGSYDPDGDALRYTVTPSTFRHSDIGSVVPVTFTVSDGKIPVSTNVNVTVVADPSLNGLTLVRDYSWLQLPAEKVVASAGLVNDD
ncbi:MAG: discoidin domain-containing protein, partial [Kiritimatiellaeota bacterium]|nr:discoidin domain-containing protein [Kiritimatiellota bacterium]